MGKMLDACEGRFLVIKAHTCSVSNSSVCGNTEGRVAFSTRQGESALTSYGGGNSRTTEGSNGTVSCKRAVHDVRNQS